MKRILPFCIASAVAFTAAAQVPMPSFLLSDAMEAQCGVANYTDEKFDFRRLPALRNVDSFFHLRDTAQVADRPNIFQTRICDAQGEFARLTFQRDPQIFRNDTVTFVSARNKWLEVTATTYLDADVTEEQIQCAVDSLRNVRTISEDLHSLPAYQDGMSYALQYLFARGGIDTAPVFNWETYFSGADDKQAILGYCCDMVRKMKIGNDIERFARKAKFEEDYIYLCEGSNANRNLAVVFFCCDGKFWAKIGASQYLSFDSVISVWRHYKDATSIVAYKLKDKFR